MKLISGSSNQQLANQLAETLGIEQIPVEISHFGNGEKRVWIKEVVKGENIALVQSFSDPTDEHIIEFLLISDALERLGARHVNAIIPWMGYSLQDKVFREGEPIAAKVVANLVSNSYIKRAIVLDLHNTSTPGFFSVPTMHLSAIKLFVEYAKENFNLTQTVVASPDFGGLKRARVFADLLETELVNIDKERNVTTGEVSAVSVTGGSVAGKAVLLFDDCVVSGSTVMEAAKLLKKQGAESVHFLVTHGLFVGDSAQKLETSEVDSIVTTNSIFHSKKSDKIHTLNLAPLLAEELSDWM